MVDERAGLSRDRSVGMNNGHLHDWREELTALMNDWTHPAKAAYHAAGQAALCKRARLNRAAPQGKHTATMERE